MKLIKAEHNEKGTWYFTNMHKAAVYIGTSSTNLNLVVKGIYKQFNGWNISWIESEDILCKYINPEK